ncbi:MAG: hypothetical protein KDK12_00160, partial [Rhodobacteraceae bacterium]|nr:hypothetical protein [Paracoccaceae bacterium]
MRHTLRIAPIENIDKSSARIAVKPDFTPEPTPRLSDLLKHQIRKQLFLHEKIFPPPSNLLKAVTSCRKYSGGAGGLAPRLRHPA